VARNRKRAKDRRARRPAAAQVGRAGYSGADEHDDAPDPLEHATPDVELANAQMALGRPELADAPLGEDEPTDDEPAEGEAALGGGAGGGGSGARPLGGGASGGGGGSGGELGPVVASAPERRRPPGSRLINFLQGSWRELQRVQWPDRRQVMQATGVVIGFVIVAGVFLGVADLIATKVANLILK